MLQFPTITSLRAVGTLTNCVSAQRSRYRHRRDVLHNGLSAIRLFLQPQPGLFFLSAVLLCVSEAMSVVIEYCR